MWTWDPYGLKEDVNMGSIRLEGRCEHGLKEDVNMGSIRLEGRCEHGIHTAWRRMWTDWSGYNAVSPRQSTYGQRRLTTLSLQERVQRPAARFTERVSGSRGPGHQLRELNRPVLQSSPDSPLSVCSSVEGRIRTLPPENFSSEAIHFIRPPSRIATADTPDMQSATVVASARSKRLSGSRTHCLWELLPTGTNRNTMWSQGAASVTQASKQASKQVSK